MTEPQTGPASEAGQPAGPGASSTGGPGHEPASSAPDDRGNESASGVATTPRTSAAQARVPQQAGREQPGYGMAEEGITPGLGAGGMVISRAANISWGALLFGSLCMIAVGIMLLVWPSITLNLVAILVGAALVASGVVRMYEGFTARAESGGMRAAYVVIGLLAVIVGVYFIRHHSLTLFVVAFLTGLYFIVHGIADIGVAASAKVPGRGLRVVLGLLSLAAGVIIIVWPAITLTLLFLILGAWLIFYGLVLAFLAFGLRRAARESTADPAAPRLASAG
jgi:uncharacterized membrane protein HdeD (DUF308 family)